jgi:hypothetical protein
MENGHIPQRGALNINDMQDAAMNLVETICSVICMPIEILLRPQYGTRYFPVPVLFFSSLLMILLPAFAAMSDTASRMLPFGHAPAAPQGMFDIASLSKLFFVSAFYHGFRTWRRMITPELEEHSYFEGPPLPFFRLIPKGNSFWFTRVVLEPALVFVGSTVLAGMNIFSSGLSLYLHIAALALLMKVYVMWFRQWQMLRDILDMKAIGPIIGKYAGGEATDEELSQIHIARLPKHLPADLRHSFVERLKASFSAKSQPKEDSTLSVDPRL